MFHGAHGLTLDGARAIFALHEAGVVIVPTSGRTVAQLREVARLLGASDFIAELGSVIVRGASESPAYDAPGWGGARGKRAAELVAQVREALPFEPHEPWFSMREHTLLLKGPPNQAAPARAWLAKSAPDLTAIDNGEIEDGLHAYHILPGTISKANAIRQDLKARGLERADAIAFGDSDGDRAMAAEVGTMVHLGGEDGPGIRGSKQRFAEGLWAAVRAALL